MTESVTCPTCQWVILSPGKFCPECGAPLNKGESPSETVTETVAPPSHANPTDQLESAIVALTGMGWDVRAQSANSVEFVSSRSGKAVTLTRLGDGSLRQSGDVRLDLSSITRAPERPDYLAQAVTALSGMGWTAVSRGPDEVELTSTRSGKRVTLTRHPDGTLRQSGEILLDLARLFPGIPRPKSGSAPKWAVITASVAGAIVLLFIVAAVGSGKSGAGSPAAKTQVPAQTPSTATAQSSTSPAPAAPAAQSPRPTPVPKPVVTYTFSANGTSVSQDLNLGKGFTTFHFSYHGGSNFIVKLLTQDGGTLELLVNTIGDYDGVTAVNIEKQGTYVVSVQASAPWATEIVQPDVNAQAGVKTAAGNGDSVVYLSLSRGLNRLHFANTGRSNFIVYLYNDTGDKRLLVNEIGSYDGIVAQTVTGNGGVFPVVVRSSGTWQVGIQ